MEFTSSWLLTAWKQIILHSHNFLSFRSDAKLGAAHQRAGLTTDSSKPSKVGQEARQGLDKVQDSTEAKKCPSACTHALWEQAWVTQVW